MKVDFSRKFRAARGTDPLKDRDTGDEVTLGSVSVNALLMDEQGQNGEQKVRRAVLAFRIIDNPTTTLDVSAEDVVLLKELIGRSMPTIVAGQALPMLDRGAE